MTFIRRKWTSHDADEWTKEDWITIILSPLAYIALMIGTVLSLLFLTSGFIILLAGIIITIVMFFIINPKLKTISSEYEKKQKGYLEYLEKTERWEE